MVEFLSGLIAGIVIYQLAEYLAEKRAQRKSNSLLFKNSMDKDE